MDAESIYRAMADHALIKPRCEERRRRTGARLLKRRLIGRSLERTVSTEMVHEALGRAGIAESTPDLRYAIAALNEYALQPENAREPRLYFFDKPDENGRFSYAVQAFDF